MEKYAGATKWYTVTISTASRAGLPANDLPSTHPSIPVTCSMDIIIDSCQTGGHVPLMEELVMSLPPGLLTDHLPLNLIHKGDSSVMSGDGLPNPGLLCYSIRCFTDISNTMLLFFCLFFSFIYIYNVFTFFIHIFKIRIFCKSRFF